MARLKWGEGPRLFDYGLDRGVLYLNNTGVPWNGLVSVDEVDTGVVNGDFYFEGNRLALTQDTGDFGAKISAYTYPDIFSEYNGYGPHDEYKRFDMAYRTNHGSGYKLHLVYDVLVRDTSRSWKTIGAKVDPSLFAWDIYATAIEVPGSSPASHLIMEIDDSPAFKMIEDVLYGTANTNPRFPRPAEIIELYEAATLLRITYNGDGTYTATGPDHMVRVLEDGRFELNAPSVFFLDKDIFVVTSH